jgi:hypothetical protein
VKFGFGVDMQEAETQAYYNRHADNSCLVIRQVLDFFTVSGAEGIFETGFLVMDYVCGRTVQDLPKDAKQRIARRVANAMKYLETINPPDPSRPGPLTKDGVPCGYLWSDSGPGRSFNTFYEMKMWLDQQLALSCPTASLDLKPHESKSRHMDITSRNIIQTDDDKICFVDWQFAGNYPGVFEVVHLKVCEADDPVFFEALIKSLPEYEEELKSKRYEYMLEVMKNNIRYGVGRHLAPP